MIKIVVPLKEVSFHPVEGAKFYRISVTISTISKYGESPPGLPASFIVDAEGNRIE